MLSHLLVTVALGAVAALFVWAFARTVKWKPSGYAYPFAFAVGMLGYAIYDEYSWYGRVETTLPARYEVVRTYATSMPYQPWTYLSPRIYKFDALDLAEARRNPADDSIVMVRVMRVTRNTSSQDVPLLVDCGTKRYAEVKPDTTFDDAGLPTNPVWSDLTGYGALIARVCAKPSGGAAAPT